DWEKKFVDLLQANGNFGEIGDPDTLNTMPFVHRTHIEIFGKFYSNFAHNVMCDTTLWLLYRSVGGLVGPKGMDHWTNLSDGKEVRRYVDCDFDRPLDYVWPDALNLADFAQIHIVKYAKAHNITNKEIERLLRLK